MKVLILRFLVAIGIVSFFQGASGQFQSFAKEGSSSSSSRSDTMGGGRSGGCGKSGA